MVGEFNKSQQQNDVFAIETRLLVQDGKVGIGTESPLRNEWNNIVLIQYNNGL